jgi:hypothetical protein
MRNQKFCNPPNINNMTALRNGQEERSVLAERLKTTTRGGFEPVGRAARTGLAAAKKFVENRGVRERGRGIPPGNL